ncbi:hypothetical protein RCL1_002720 [Eukaryota sp. TZLM3-RCL]
MTAADTRFLIPDSHEFLRQKRLQRERELSDFLEIEQLITSSIAPIPRTDTSKTISIQVEAPKRPLSSIHVQTDNQPTQTKPKNPSPVPTPCKCGFSNRVFTLEKEKANIQQDLDVSVAKNESFEAEINALKATVSRLRRRITLLEEERDGLKSTLVDQNTEKLPKAEEKKVFCFDNGTVKEVCPTGLITITFKNGDVKKTHPDGKVVYTYTSVGTIHTTLPSGVQIYEFANGQREVHTANQKEIVFADGTVKVVKDSGEEESTFPDGTKQVVSSDGMRTIYFSNGQREIHEPNGRKQRFYVDGTVKNVEVDGSVVTYYPNGKVRVKDSSGRLLSEHGP